MDALPTSLKGDEDSEEDVFPIIKPFSSSNCDQKIITSLSNAENKSNDINKSNNSKPIHLTEGKNIVFLNKETRKKIKKNNDITVTAVNPIDLGSFQNNESKASDKMNLSARVKLNSDSTYKQSNSGSNTSGIKSKELSSQRKCKTYDEDHDMSHHKSSSKKKDDSSIEKKGVAMVTCRAWDKETESSLSQLNLFKLQDTEIVETVNKKYLDQIREHYLGLRKEKRKIQKPSEKFRNIFNFEWSPNEDTHKGESNILYQSRVEPQFLFGRGFRAGVDVREQRRHNNFYDELVKQKAILEETDKYEKSLHFKSDSKDILVRSRDLEANDPNKKHWTQKSTEEMTERDWRIFREDFDIYIKGGRIPPPIRKWSEARLPKELLASIKHCGYDKPTPIQMQTIPISLEQRDLIGIAETGSGKTAAFVLPLLTYVKNLPPLTDETSQDGPYALILAPSRELAIQIEEETLKFASFCSCRTVAVVGGRSAESQAFELRRGAEIVVGTPGRIKDCLERAYTVLSQCNYVVLDEADRMIDLGFEDVVNWILDQIPSSNMKSEDQNIAFQQELESKAGYRRYRLTQMFSATMPTAVERLTKKYLKNPAYVSIGDPGAGKRSIEQQLEFLPEARKRQRLQEILESSEPPIMVFVNQKKLADMLAKTLSKMNFRVASLHGGKAQDNREKSLQDFKNGDVDILVATDVAGRGIDVEGVKLVINFDMPKDIGSYTHRIGRTGRAGRKGLAISFCTEEDSGIYYDLRQLLISTNNMIPLELNNHPMAKTKPGTTVLTANVT